MKVEGLKMTIIISILSIITLSIMTGMLILMIYQDIINHDTDTLIEYIILTIMIILILLFTIAIILLIINLI
jgi:hypothetical protein